MARAFFLTSVLLYGCSASSNYSGGDPDTTPPTVPASLTATASSSLQIALAWSPAADNKGVSGYRIERCSGAGCSNFAQVGTSATPAYADSGLTASTSYSYRVRAADAAGNLGGYSNTASATTPASTDAQAPMAPSGLAASAPSPSQIGLTWTASTDNVGVTGYRIERCSGAGCSNFAQVGTTTGATSFTNTGLTASTSYSYRVRAADAAGNLSGYSNTASAITPASADTQAPTAPSSLIASASSSSQIALTWTASTDNVAVTGYRIERCSGSGCSNFAQVGTTTGATSFTNTGLTASTSYRYRVRAADAAGNLSGYSNTASATTPASTDAQAPTAPSGLAASASSNSQIGLTWTASTDNVAVTGYRIERCSGAGCSGFVQIGTTGGTTTFSDSGLAAGTSYSYRVRASDAANNLSGYSNTASATTSSGGTSITVSVTPARGGVTTSQALSVTATLTNDSGNQGVTWSFTSTGSTSGGGFLPSSSTSGNPVTFTAPSSPGVVTITATAVADSAKTDSATVGVTDLTGVLTYHNNLSRDGSNQKEYALKTSNVGTATFGKLFSCTTDGAIYAQPLWIPKVSIGGGTHNVVLAASMRDTVYAFDADKSPCATYWSKNLIPSGETYGDYADLGSSDIFPDIGILGTPVIDPSTHAIYLVTKTKSTSTGSYVQRLHALNLADGSERANSPVTLNSGISVPGSCEGGSTVSFNAKTENQRAGLVLVNGTVYVAWASHGDNDPYHGWVIAFNSSTLAVVNKWNASPNRVGTTTYCRGGIWMSGGAPAADTGNNIYVMTGNGVFDANTGGSDYGDSYVKLSGSLAVSDYFTPADQASLNAGDQDVGSGGTALLIDQTSGPVAHLMVGATKSATFYLLNRDNMGHFNAAGDGAAVQSWSVTGRSFSTPAFWNNTLYYFGVVFGGTQTGQAFAFDSSTGLFSTSPAHQTSTGLKFPGATPSVSSAGTAGGTGIVWAIDSSVYGTRDSGSVAAGPAVLHAYSAADLSELWNSSQGSGNTAGNAVKFTVPTVANGKVYIGTRGNDTTVNSPTVFGQVDVYGLLPN